MWLLKYWKAIAVGTLCVAAVWFAHHSGKQQGKDQIQSQWNAEKAQQALQMVRQIDAMTTQVQEAQNHARQRETTLRRDADAARVAVGGLREQLEAARTELATASLTSSREYAATLSELLAECTSAYQELAEKADGHASDTVMLIEAWPGRKNK